jgi:hypothetical protein
MMENILEAVSQYGLPIATAIVGSMYLDAKHHVVKDIGVWRARRLFQRSLIEGARLMEDYHTLYHALELNDPKAEGFWFEGRSWTFANIRSEADKLAQWLLDQGIRTKGKTVNWLY